MLRRLIGEDISLSTHLDPDLAHINGDSGQLEQVLLNLAVNARDAMPAGGRLTITTANVEIGDGDAQHPRDLAPGSYVAVGVSDTGEGMDEETLGRVFEPFFTTKEEGKGTGLGLATVFGVVKQSGGDIHVRSEPGRGATFTMYLPRATAPVLALEPSSPVAQTPRGWETILVVEDEAVVRRLERDVLTSSGYTVLEAGGPLQAIEISSRYEDDIHLLLTDVVMPEMNGQELARRLIVERPDMRVIFASGYAADAFGPRGLVDPAGAFLAKPLTPLSIGCKVRNVLDDTTLRRAS
jgi:CheY-like chemotaxis protein